MVATLAWTILFLPLLAALIVAGFLQRHPVLAARVSIGAVVAAFGLSASLFFALSENQYGVPFRVAWLSVGELHADLGLQLDRLSLLMLLVVTGVGAAIHIYSAGYMEGDRGFARYFSSLSLFTFSMLGVVLASNFLMMLVFWELVGLCSYLLIGFWYERPAAADAAKKAFLTNRVGDFGFLLGILMVWTSLGSLEFETLKGLMTAQPYALGAAATVAGLLLFCGAVGKSAQFPLHVWLPDAMEGPTPVSALIHAATMVAAGVYLLCRLFFLLNPPALEVIAWVGGGTALLAALIAIQQNDIKRILAYSTLSQLGYMVMAVGLQGPGPAMYHLTTHACFKALLFLGAGSVIHALHHEQDIWKMGGLKNRMPITSQTFLFGTLALSGVPPFSGFFSKDEILLQAFHQDVGLFILALGVAGLTAFYMTRLVWVAFWGAPRSAASEQAHESPGVMTWPLRVLAIPTVLAGFFGIEPFLKRHFGGADHAPALPWLQQLFAPFNHAPLAAFFGLLAVVAGFTLALSLYRQAKHDPLQEMGGALTRAMRNRFYFDELYTKLIALTQEPLARFADAVDRWLVAGLLVRGLHGATELAGRALRLTQTGNLQTYAFLFLAGLAVILHWILGN